MSSELCTRLCMLPRASPATPPRWRCWALAAKLAQAQTPKPARARSQCASVRQACQLSGDRAFAAKPLVVINGEARAYPIQVLTWHEIVNDRVADVPVAVTYCPLCNTAIVFERMFDGSLLDFGMTGRLRYSNVVMYDRQSETWWQQGTGAGIAGKYAGQKLVQRPVSLIAWSDFKSTHPAAQGQAACRNDRSQSLLVFVGGVLPCDTRLGAARRLRRTMSHHHQAAGPLDRLGASARHFSTCHSHTPR